MGLISRVSSRTYRFLDIQIMALNRNWLLSSEGIVISLALWLSCCANLTMIFAFPNDYVQKHFILTLTCTSWIGLLYLNLLKLNFFEGKVACDKTQRFVSIFGVTTSIVSALILLFTDGYFDAVTENFHSGVNWFCALELFVVTGLYLSIVFIERVVEYIQSLKLCMPGNKDAAAVSESSEKPVETTNDNFDTQHIVIPVENDKVEEVQEQEEIDEKTPSHASFEIIPEQNNKQEDDTASEQNSNVEENQELNNKEDNEEANEKTELLEDAPTKETHAQIGERKDSDV